MLSTYCISQAFGQYILPAKHHRGQDQPLTYEYDMLYYTGITNPYHVLPTGVTKPNGSNKSTVRMLNLLPDSTI